MCFSVHHLGVALAKISGNEENVFLGRARSSTTRSERIQSVAYQHIVNVTATVTVTVPLKTEKFKGGEVMRFSVFLGGSRSSAGQNIHGVVYQHFVKVKKHFFLTS